MVKLTAERVWLGSQAHCKWEITVWMFCVFTQEMGEPSHAVKSIRLSSSGYAPFRVSPAATAAPMMSPRPRASKPRTPRKARPTSSPTTETTATRQRSSGPSPRSTRHTRSSAPATCCTIHLVRPKHEDAVVQAWSVPRHRPQPPALRDEHVERPIQPGRLVPEVERSEVQVPVLLPPTGQPDGLRHHQLRDQARRPGIMRRRHALHVYVAVHRQNRGLADLEKWRI